MHLTDDSGLRIASTLPRGRSLPPAIRFKKEGKMRFFKSQLTDSPFSTTDALSESSRSEGIDLAGQAALSSALASYVQATAAIGSTTLDARHSGVGDPVHAIAPAAPVILDSGKFVPEVFAPMARAARSEGVAAADATAAQVVEPTHATATDAAPSADVVASGEIPVAHAVHSASIETAAAAATAPSVGNAEASAAVAPAVGADSAGATGSASEVPHAAIDPVAVGAGGVDATTGSLLVDGTDVGVGTTLESTSTTAVVEAPGGQGHDTSLAHPADGGDLGESHSTLPLETPSTCPTPDSVAVAVVDSIGETASTGSTAESADTGTVETLVAHGVDLTTLANAKEAVTVAGPDAHAMVGTVIIDDLDSAKNATLAEHTDASEVEAVMVPEVAPLPEVADGADRWENHSMFSVKPPGDATTAEVAVGAVAGGTAVASGSDPAPASTDGADALQHFLDSWLCDLPVQPESLRHARLPEFTLPSLSDEGTGTPETLAITATVFDSTTCHVVAVAAAPLVDTEPYAVL